MKQKRSLEETQTSLDSASGANVLKLDIWSRARELAALHNIVNLKSRTTSEQYSILIEFDNRKADEKPNGRKKTILRNSSK